MARKIMLGNEAFARGAWEAGVRVASSYPGTPSTEITETLSKCGDEIHVEWAPNEKVGVEVAFGASVGGARALSCMKHVGLNVAADPFFTAAYNGVNGGFVVLVADDTGCHSSQNEQDSRYHGRAAGVPVLEPADPQECKDFMKLAYDMSEKYDTLILMKSNTRISHSRGIVEEEDRIEREVIPYEKNFQKYVSMPAMARRLHVEQEKRLNRIAEDASQLMAGGQPLNRVEMNDPEIGIVTSGICYQYVKEALPEASVFKMGLINPMPLKDIADFASKVKKLYVIEEGNPFFEEQIRAAGIAVHGGKELFTIQGEYSVNMIRKAMGKPIPETALKEEVAPAPGRPPLLCAGCPHKGLFYVLSKLKTTVMGDIGCYTLAALAPTNAIDTCLCMGGSIGMEHGFEKATGDSKNLVAVLGDSTFLHSGMTGLLNMVYNEAKGTVIILDNRITGMTGHQQNPGSGKNAKGEMAPAVNFEELVKALGVKNVTVIDPFEVKDLEAVIKRETGRDELSVIITRRPCVMITKQEGTPNVITDNCKNCRQCMKVGCPAIEMKDGRPYIVTTSCVGCGLCTRVCPFDAIKSLKEGR